MTKIQKDEYVFEVDIEKTIEYYKTHSLCECECCENFYTQIYTLSEIDEKACRLASLLH